MKAEAYYQMMQFEYALMYYHRGNKIRPEVQAFRLGIQKSQEAIENSIGGKTIMFSVYLRFTSCLGLLVCLASCLQYQEC